MATGPEEMHAAILRNLPDTTGRTLRQWLAIARAHTRPKTAAVRTERDPPVKALGAWLKAEYGLGSVTAHCIAWHALKPADHQTPGGDSLVDAQYAGKKAHLRPICDAIVAMAGELGPEARILPRSTQVTLARKATFAIIKASTNTRVDLGLRLAGVKATKRLIEKDAFSGNTTHLVGLTDVSQVDAQLERWVRKAFELRGS